MQELRQEYPLVGLLRMSGLARSTFYYQVRLLRLTDKYASLKARIRRILLNIAADTDIGALRRRSAEKA